MRIGVIGCGGIAQVHAKSIRELNKVAQLVAVCDCEYERAVRMAEEYGGTESICHAYVDWREMIDRETLDVVHICTPHHLHTQMAIAALEKGISVFLEKPPAIDREQFAELCAAVREAEGHRETLAEDASGSARVHGAEELHERGARLAVCFQNRYNESVQYAKKLLCEGTLGAVKGARAFVTWRRDAAYYLDSPWRGKLATEGGGALINQGIHTLDLIQYLIGEKPLDADASMSNFHLAGQIEVEDTFTAFVRYPGAQAILYVTTAHVADVPPIIELECEHGRLRIEEDEARIFRFDGGDDAVRFPEKQFFGKSYWGAGHRDAIADFYGAVLENRECMLDFAQTRDSVELMLSLYEAARR